MKWSTFIKISLLIIFCYSYYFYVWPMKVHHLQKWAEIRILLAYIRKGFGNACSKNNWPTNICKNKHFMSPTKVRLHVKFKNGKVANGKVMDVKIIARHLIIPLSCQKLDTF